MSTMKEQGCAIVSVALRTALGGDPALVHARWLTGERGKKPIARFDAHSYPCQEAAAIDAPPTMTRDRRHLRRMGSMGMDVGLEAMALSSKDGLSKDTPSGERLGLFAGFGGLRAHWEDLMPAMAEQKANGAEPWANGLGKFHPFWMLKHLSNNAHALLAEALDARGEGATYGGANAGAQALEAACAALDAGVVDAALVVAYDSLLEPETLIDLGVRGQLAHDKSARPAYDDGAHGYVPGEAAAAVLLMRANDGRASDGRALRVRAYSAADGARGEPGRPCLASLLARANLANVVGVDGASRANADLDGEERLALAGVLAETTPLTSSQASTGQLGGAAAVVQCVLLAECLRLGSLPGIAGLHAAAPGPLVPLGRAAELPVAAEPRPRALLGLSSGAPGLLGAVVVLAGEPL